MNTKLLKEIIKLYAALQFHSSGDREDIHSVSLSYQSWWEEDHPRGDGRQHTQWVATAGDTHCFDDQDPWVAAEKLKRELLRRLKQLSQDAKARAAHIDRILVSQ